MLRPIDLKTCEVSLINAGVNHRCNRQSMIGRRTINPGAHQAGQRRTCIRLAGQRYRSWSRVSRRLTNRLVPYRRRMQSPLHRSMTCDPQVVATSQQFMSQAVAQAESRRPSCYRCCWIPNVNTHRCLQDLGLRWYAEFLDSRLDQKRIASGSAAKRIVVSFGPATVALADRSRSDAANKGRSVQFVAAQLLNCGGWVGF